MIDTISGQNLKQKMGLPSFSPVWITRLYRLGGGVAKRIYIILYNSIKGQPSSPFSWYSEVNKTSKINGIMLRYGVPFDGIDLIKGITKMYVARPIPIERFVGDMSNSLVLPIDLAYYFRDKEILRRMHEMDSGGLSGVTPEHVIAISTSPYKKPVYPWDEDEEEPSPPPKRKVRKKPLRQRT